MITLDGSMGEGGGQILRSALCLSMLTGQPFVLNNIRAARSRPGLQPQHLSAVQAAVTISRAEVQGNRIGSDRLVFQPDRVKAGNYHFDIGTAGATSLVLQTVLLPLAMVQGDSQITITGGTHVPWSPCFHYLDLHWRQFLANMGVKFDLEMNRAGFYPEGGGEISATISGNAQLKPLELLRRGKLSRIRGLSAVANLPVSIAERQQRQAGVRLKSLLPQVERDISIESFPAISRGTVLLLLAEFEYSQACFFTLGARGKPAERVADEAVEALELFLNRDGVIDRWLADQLLLPLALANGTSVIHSSEITQHLLTNAEVIRQFLPVEILLDGKLGETGRVNIQKR